MNFTRNLGSNRLSPYRLLISLTTVQNRYLNLMSKFVEKVWGSEQWLRNDDKYCMKILTLKAGYQSSLHMHKVKVETFLVVSGAVKLEVIKGYRIGHDSREVKILR